MTPSLLPNEKMKKVTDGEGLYSITNQGRLWSHRRNIFMKCAINSGGYYQHSLALKNKCRNKKRCRLIMEAFVPNPKNKKSINHINGDKTDDNINNLEWATLSENVQHAYNVGLHKITEKKRNAARTIGKRKYRIVRERLGKQKAQEIRSLYRKGDLLQKEIAMIYGVSRQTISYIISNRTYSRIGQGHYL